MADQAQLFDAGQVRTSRRRYRTDRRRKQEHEKKIRKITRLVGEGRIRFDPVTGNRYETHGRYQLKRAYQRECQGCGNEWWSSTKTHRESQGLCGTCRQRLGLTKVTRPDGSKRVTSSGYVEIKHDGVWRLEHRLVIEQLFERVLDPDETVHHINGNRADNRPRNLQLRRGHHGPGQAYQCADCGSQNIEHVALATPTRGHPSRSRTQEGLR